MLMLYRSHLVTLGLKRPKNGFFGQIFSTSDDKNAEKPIFQACLWVRKGMGVFVCCRYIGKGTKFGLMGSLILGVIEIIHKGEWETSPLLQEQGFQSAIWVQKRGRTPQKLFFHNYLRFPTIKYQKNGFKIKINESIPKMYPDPLFCFTVQCSVG